MPRLKPPVGAIKRAEKQALATARAMRLVRKADERAMRARVKPKPVKIKKSDARKMGQDLVAIYLKHGGTVRKCLT